MVSEASEPVGPLKEEPVQSTSQNVEANGLKVAVDAAIIEHAQQNAASEYGEARRYRRWISTGMAALMQL